MFDGHCELARIWHKEGEGSSRSGLPGPRLSRKARSFVTETVAEILDAYRGGAIKPEDIVARSFARIRAHDDPAIFIALREEAEVLAEARSLAKRGEKSLPLYGIPVSVKDNIDVKGLPTTAACPAYSYRPSKDAAWLRGCAKPARSFSAKPISISLQPASLACARLMALAATCSIRSSFPADRAPARRSRSAPA